jgi:hypothetical protein
MAYRVDWVVVVIKVLIGALWLGAMTLLSQSAAAADCHTHAGGDQVNGGIAISTAQCGEPQTTVTSDDGDDPIRDSDLDAICVSTAITMGVNPFEFCQEPSQAGAIEISPAFVAQALRFIPLPPTELRIQPPNGRTLVNLDTNFFTETREFDRTVTLLGQRVDLHIVPSRFGWHFGDGESLATSEPGAPYPRLDVTHRYLEKGRVAPSVDTTYTARFRVNGGPWRAVPGSVTIAGPAVDLAVLTATPTLVGYN